MSKDKKRNGYYEVHGGQVYVDPSTGQRYLVKDGKIVGRNPNYLLNTATATYRRPYFNTPWEAAQRVAKYNPDWREVYDMSPDMETLNAVTGNILDYTDPAWWGGRATKAITGDEDLANKVELGLALSEMVFPAGFVKNITGINKLKGLGKLSLKNAKRLPNKLKQNGTLSDDDILKLWTTENGRTVLVNDEGLTRYVGQQLSSRPGLKGKLPTEMQKEFDDIWSAIEAGTTEQAATTAANTTARDLYYSINGKSFTIPQGSPIKSTPSGKYVSTKHGDIKLDDVGQVSTEPQDKLLNQVYEQVINKQVYKGKPISKVTGHDPVDVAVYFNTPNYSPRWWEHLYTQPTYIKNEPATIWTKITKKPTNIGSTTPVFNQNGLDVTENLVKYQPRRFSFMRSAGTAGLLGGIAGTVYQGLVPTAQKFNSGLGDVAHTILYEGIAGNDSTQTDTTKVSPINKNYKALSKSWQHYKTIDNVKVDSAQINGRRYYIPEEKDENGNYTAIYYGPNGWDTDNIIKVTKNNYKWVPVKETPVAATETTYPNAAQGRRQKSVAPQSTDTTSYLDNIDINGF